MERDEAIRILREHADELRERGVTRLQLFGSVARGEQTSESDVDLLADFDQGKRLSLLGVCSIQVRLEEILHTKGDLSSPGWLKPRVSVRVMKDAVHVF